MEQKAAKAFTDVLSSDNVSRDFLNCCSFFIDSDYFLIKERLYKKQIWNLSHFSKQLVKNEANQAIIDLAFETICNYEKRWTGSGLAYLKTITHPESKINPKKIRANSNVLLSAVQKNLNCDITKNIFSQIRKYGNPQLSISVTREPIEKPVLRFVSTPSVRLKVPGAFTIVDGTHKNCKFFMVNGAVCSSSEITKLLNESFENKNTIYFLVCKSFNDEVLYTLKENYDREITNVIPVEFGFDLDSINSLADLHSIVGGLPFSSDLGDVLSAADFERLGISDCVRISGESFIVTPSVDNTAHLLNLVKRIQKTENDSDERKILSRRSIALKGNACRIALPKNSKFDSVETNIRHSAIMMHQMSKFGIAEIKIGASKFYIPVNSCTMIPELKSTIDNLFKTKIYLPRRESWTKRN